MKTGKKTEKSPFSTSTGACAAERSSLFSEKNGKHGLKKLSGRIYFIEETEKTIMPASNTPPMPEKKKHFELMDPVRLFLRDLSGDVKQELNSLIWMLEENGFLEYPYGEKIGGDDDLFAIRVIQTGNIRVFYVYGRYDIVYGIHGYVKKTEKIPRKELKQARTVLKLLIERGLI